MLTNFRTKIYSLYLVVISSIAFYPTLIAILLLLLSLLLLSLETSEVTNFFMENASYLVISDPDTARAILSTLIGGILSLMVFSFSMVMVLLNQASSNFSPRLLPGLISDKRNQIVLGTYLGTIIYNIIVLISIVSDSDKFTINGLSILIGIVLGVICLGMFIFFIHSISTGIQINNILDQIYRQSKKRIDHLISQKNTNVQPIDVEGKNWQEFKCDKAIYYQGVDVEGLSDILQKFEVNVKVIPFKGKYVLPNTTVMMYDKELTEDELARLNGFIIYSNNHQTDDNYILGIKQMTEVGVKAMSPGINDPGTAVMTIDYLTELLALRMQLGDIELYQSDESSYTLELTTVNFDDMLYQMLAAYRQYCKHDIILMEKLITMLKYLKVQKAHQDTYHESINNQLDIIRQDYQANIQNDSDKKKLDQLMEMNLFN